MGGSTCAARKQVKPLPRSRPSQRRRRNVLGGDSGPERGAPGGVGEERRTRCRSRPATRLMGCGTLRQGGRGRGQRDEEVNRSVASATKAPVASMLLLAPGQRLLVPAIAGMS